MTAAGPVLVAEADRRLWHLVAGSGQSFCGHGLVNVVRLIRHDTIEDARRSLPRESLVRLCTLCVVRRLNGSEPCPPQPTDPTATPSPWP